MEVQPSFLTDGATSAKRGRHPSAPHVVFMVAARDVRVKGAGAIFVPGVAADGASRWSRPGGGLVTPADDRQALSPAGQRDGHGSPFGKLST